MRVDSLLLLALLCVYMVLLEKYKLQQASNIQLICDNS